MHPLNEKQQAALTRLMQQMDARKAALADARTAIDSAEAQITGYLNGLAIEMGVPGRWTLSPDRKAIIEVNDGVA